MSRKNRLPFTVFFLLCLVPLLVFFFAFFPAGMSFDSLDQWGQITRGEYDDWHPVLYTAMILGVRRIVDSPYPLVLLQIVLMAAASAYGMLLMLRNRVPLVVIAFLALWFFWLDPLNGFIGIMVWKDVLYSTVLFFISLWSFHAIERKSLGLRLSVKTLIVAGLLVTLVLLLRYNGWLTLAFVLVGWFVLFPLDRRRLATTALISVLAAISFQSAMERRLHVRPTHITSLAPAFVMLHQMGAVLASHGEITEGELHFLYAFLSRERWHDFYTPYALDPLIYEGKGPINLDDVYAKRRDIARVWFDIVFRSRENLYAATAHQWKMSSLLWAINQPKGSYYYVSEPGIEKNRSGLTTRSLLPSLVHPLQEVHEFLLDPSWNWLLSRPALYLHMISFVSFLWVLERRYSLLVLTLPVYANALGLAMSLPIQDVRYAYSIYLICPFLVGIHFSSMRNPRYRQPTTIFPPDKLPTGSHGNSIS